MPRIHDVVDAEQAWGQTVLDLARKVRAKCAENDAKHAALQALLFDRTATKAAQHAADADYARGAREAQELQHALVHHASNHRAFQ